VSEVQQEIERRSIDGRLPCMVAFDIAEKLGGHPNEIRERADRSEIRISHCQLGLFGFQAFGDKRFVASLSRVPDRLAAALREAAASGALPCAAAWKIAEREGLPKPVVGSAAEALEIRIAPCQLGCF
jgi:hypothetical protein